MTDAAPSTEWAQLTPPSPRTVAARKALLVATFAALAAAVVVAVVYAIVEFDFIGIFVVAALVVVALNLLVWRALVPRFAAAPTTGRRAAIAISATLLLALASVAAVFALIMLTFFVVAWTGQ